MSLMPPRVGVGIISSLYVLQGCNPSPIIYVKNETPFEIEARKYEPANGLSGSWRKIAYGQTIDVGSAWNPGTYQYGVEIKSGGRQWKVLLGKVHKFGKDFIVTVPRL